jgi:hypothetical protein
MTTDFDDNTDGYKNLEAYMDAVEGNGPQTTLFALLKESGVDMPAPNMLSDSELTVLLWKIIDGLADMGVYMTSTNHLSDRELYTVLWQDTLLQDHPIVSHEFPMTAHIDLLGGWSDEDQEIYLKYYADDEERAQIASQTNAAIPEHEDPPFRRDHLLPGA